jgi:hypothetical protein
MAQTSPYSTRFKVIATLVLTLAISLLVLAALSLGDNEDPVLSADDAQVVEALIPRRDSQIPQQSTVGIQTVVSWSGTLVVNGVEIPEDELVKTPEIGLIEYTPGEGKAVEQFQAGRNCVTAIIWPLAQGRGPADRQIPWCFEVV